jgi:hypothetical protein
MTQSLNVSRRRTRASARQNPFNWPAIHQWAVAVAAAGLLAGCAGDVTMQNSRTGATATCAGRHRELDPWSQTMSCVTDYETAGWIRIDQE